MCLTGGGGPARVPNLRVRKHLPAGGTSRGREKGTFPARHWEEESGCPRG